VGTGDDPIAIASHPGGKFIYVANQGEGISAFSVNRDNGTLTPIAGSASAAGKLPSWIGITPDGKFLYALTISSPEISAYSINSDTGVLTALSPAVPLAGPPARAAVPPFGRFVYVALGSLGTQVLRIGSDGNLTNVKTVPAAPCSNVKAIVLDRNTRYAFVADGGGGVCNYALNPSNGDLVPIGPALNPGGRGAVSIAMDPTATVLVTANNLSNDVTAFAIAVDGTLTPIAGSPLPAGQAPSDVTVDPSGNYVYVTNSMENTISVFTISSSKTLNSSGSWTTGPNPQGISVIP
jgi:6-phosphogluconolactonase (cycloisomerase 2 family)